MSEYEPIKTTVRDNPPPRWCMTHEVAVYAHQSSHTDCDHRPLYVEKGCRSEWLIHPLDGGERQKVACNRLDPHDIHEGVYFPDNEAYNCCGLVSVMVRWRTDV